MSRLPARLALAFCALTAQAQTSAPPKYDALATDILSKLIAIRSTHSNGTLAAAKSVEARALAAGFAPADINLLTPKEFPQAANILIRLHGKSSDNAILYICHLDVVEARREDWTYDPFELTVKDGWMYGRGTIDMKGQDAAVLASLIRMKQEGVVPAHDIIVAFTADEEAGGAANGVAWLAKEHRDLIKAALVVNPDGGEAATKKDRKLYIAVQTSEKMFLTFSLETTDKGGHSSRPTVENPIYRLSAGLERLSKLRFPVHLTDTTRLYFERRAATETGQLQADMRAILRTPMDTAAAERLSAEVETNIQLRTTCITTMIEGGHAENALPQRAKATVQCRAIPGETQDSVAAAIRKAVDDPKIVLGVVTPGQPAPDSPPSPTILTMVENITHSMWPGVVVLPEMSPGASDSIHLRAIGMPSYGIDGMFDDLDDGRAHGRDERIGVKAFSEEVEFTYRLMKAVSGAN
jgi:acetylornithine deacetylase/succinyl-diaminopimelate desuccinylase-like protein